MGTELTLPKGFGASALALAGRIEDNDELGAGVQSSYGIVGYRGKVWSIKFGGNETQLMRDDGDGPRGSIEVVVVKASPAISKIFYANGYQDGSNSPPDCWSTNGVTPDPAAQAKQCTTCAACPMNAWGSRVTDAGKQGKACSDSRRIAIVPLNDMANEAFGGPMLLRVPAASLKDLKAYGELLKSVQHVPYSVATRIKFDSQEAFPKFVFEAMRPLTKEEAEFAVELRAGKAVANVLNESHAVVHAEEEPKLPANPFTDVGHDTAAQTAQVQSSAPAAKATAPKAMASAASAAAKPAVKVAPAPAPVATQAAPASFDEMLDNIL